MKDYQEWMPIKATINNELRRPTYRDGDIFWVCIGENVGFEQDGKGSLFARPVLVLKKFSSPSFR